MYATTVNMLITFFILISRTAVDCQTDVLGDFDLPMQKDGLNNHEITCIQKDGNGFLWIGTPDGLLRYDGYSLHNYRTSTTKNSIADNFITSLVTDRLGNVWIGHGNGMVAYYDFIKDSFTHYPVYEQSKGEAVTLLYLDSRNQLWAAIERVGLFIFDSGKNRFSFKSSLPNADLLQLMLDRNSNNSISGMQEDSEGNYWIAAKNGLYYYEHQKNKIMPVTDGKESMQLRNILIDSLGNLWITSWGCGLVHYNIAKKAFTKFLWEEQKIGVSNITRSLLWKSPNEIWVATYDGLAFFNLDTKKFLFYSKESQNFPGVWIDDLLLDPTTLWMVSEKGLAKLRLERLKFTFREQEVTSTSSNDDFYICSFLFNDTITNVSYTGTSFADGLHMTKSGKDYILKFETSKFSEQHLIIRGYLYDRKGNVWILTRDYLYQVNQKNNKLVKIQLITDDGKSPAFSKIIEGSNGIIWIASLRKGLFLFDPQNDVYAHYLPTESGNSICSNSITDILEDDQNRIWATSSQDGLSVLDPQLNYFTNYNRGNSKLPSNRLNALTKDKSGNIWIATMNGISICKKDSGLTFKNWSVDDGLPSDRILHLKSDAMNNIWGITSSNLLFAVRVEQQRTMSVKTFDSSDGIDRPLFGIGDDGTGNFFISASSGYYSFDPKEVLKPLSNPPHLVFTSILANNSQVLPTKDSLQNKTLTLDYNQNVISFEFAALNFIHQSKNLYSYQLENIDVGWSPASVERSVKYSALPPGDYTFKVRLVGSTYINNPETSLHVTIAKPFWKTWWFTLSNSLLAAGILATLHKLRLGQVKTQQAQKSEFLQKIAEAEMHALRLQMNPHFIFNSLNSINRFILKSDVEQATHYLTKFSKLIRLILDNSKNKAISLEQELTTIRLYIELESVRFNGKFNYSVHLDDSINPEAINMPPMLIQPYIENAIWHGLLHKNTVGNISIFFNKENDQLVCTIKDDGVGRKMAQQLKSKSAVIEKSYGMKITKDRLAYDSYSGSKSTVEVVDLISNDGISLGTKVIIKIKIVECELN